MEIEKVFKFFSNPKNLKKITPDSLCFNIITPDPIKMSKGILLDYTIKLFRFPVHWKTFISDYDPPNFFVDQQIKGPYTLWHHTHIFNKVDNGVEIIKKSVTFSSNFLHFTSGTLRDFHYFSIKTVAFYLGIP